MTEIIGLSAISSTLPKRETCDFLLDPFMGSGITAVVARQLGRHYLGIELSPAYCEMAQRRIAREAPPTLWEHLESAVESEATA